MGNRSLHSSVKHQYGWDETTLLGKKVLELWGNHRADFYTVIL